MWVSCELRLSLDEEVTNGPRPPTPQTSLPPKTQSDTSAKTKRSKVLTRIPASLCRPGKEQYWQQSYWFYNKECFSKPRPLLWVRLVPWASGSQTGWLNVPTQTEGMLLWPYSQDVKRGCIREGSATAEFTLLPFSQLFLKTLKENTDDLICCHKTRAGLWPRSK